MKKKRIVWIDDDINKPKLLPYIDELEENNFEVIKVEKIDNLLSILKKEAERTLSAILVDINMPPGHHDFRKTRGGLRTGLFILEDILKEDSLNNIPIIVFTNVDDIAVNNYCTNKSILCLKKEDCFSYDFVITIDEIIKKKG